MMQDLTVKKISSKILIVLPFQFLLIIGLAYRIPPVVLLSFAPLLIYGFASLLVNPLHLLWFSMFLNLTNIAFKNVALYVVAFALLIPSFLLTKCFEEDKSVYFDSFDLLFVSMGSLLLISLPQWRYILKGGLGFLFLFLIPYFEILVLRSYVNKKNLIYSLYIFAGISFVFNMEVLAAVVKTFFRGGFSIVALHRIGIGWAYSNYIAAIANLFIPLNLAIYMTFKNKFRYFSLFNLAVLFLSMLSTISRGGFLAFILSVITFGLGLAIAEGKTKYIMGVMATIGGVLLVIFKTLLGKFLLFRFAFAIAKDASIQNRYRMWAQAIEHIKEHPLIGGGPNQNQVFSGVLFTENPHNFYLKIGMDAGVIGIVLFVAVLIFLFRRSLKLLHAHEREMRILGVAFLTTLVVASFNAAIEPTLSGYHYSPIFWFIMGLLLALTSDQKSQNGQA